jgi:circadian clock protein KaiB
VKKIKSSTKAFEKALKKNTPKKYVLKLFITGVTPRSTRAIGEIKKICEEHLNGRYDLEIIDIYQQAELAKGEQIIAAPTLIKKLPLPLRRFIGDMSDSDRILIGLDLRPKKNNGGERPNEKDD